MPVERISPIGAAKAFVLRGRTLPLVELAEALGQARTETEGAEAHVVVAAVGGSAAGIRVDRLGERMEVMLKPIEGLLAGARGVAGTTLLGDGRVLIVLDVQELLAGEDFP